MNTFSNFLSELSKQISLPRLKYRRLLLPCFLLLLFVQPSTREITFGVLSDAFIQVSSFVAATLTLYYWAMHVLGQDRISHWMQKHPLSELALCSVFGGLPGCGGAIVVITQFTQGKVSFGAVVAVLTATMGDAAFLILAQKPIDGLLIIATTMTVGIGSGWVVNLIHRRDFMRPNVAIRTKKMPLPNAHSVQGIIANASLVYWQCLLIPILIVGLLSAFQVDVNHWLGIPNNSVEWVGAVLCFIAIALWALSSKGDSYQKVTSEEPSAKRQYWMLKVARDSQFVTSWVVVAFLAFELTVFVFDVHLSTVFSDLGAGIILLSTLVGFLPGCGPQIMVTGLYLQQAIPFSAQLANAISNDGDALFPAIAMAPKAAVVATVYSAVPALFVGYTYYWLFE